MSRSVLITKVLLETPCIVFSGITDGEEQRRRFVSTEAAVLPRSPQAGEVWRIGGRITRHPVYGEQVVIDEAMLEKPSGRLIIHVLAGPRFEGVGPKTAERLWQAYGENLYDILARGDEDALAAVAGRDPRGQAQAVTIVEGWRGLALEADTMTWLDRHAVDPRLAIKLIGCYGSETISALTEDPYRLVVFGASWSSADNIARSLGFGIDHPHRLCAAVEDCAYRRFSTGGDTWVTEDGLRTDLAMLVGPELVGLALAAAAASAAILAVPGGYQTAGCSALEQYVARGITRRLESARERHATYGAATKSVPDHGIGEWQVEASMALNEGQQEAVAVALAEPFAVISGGAGTGKTATLRAIAELASKNGETVILLALSGRAALRIKEATGLGARTIAGFLQIFERNAADLPEQPLVIIDEASMVDITLLYRIMSALGERGRILLVGDQGQLPPIGPGLTLHALVDHPSVPAAVLWEIVRQAADTGIPEVGKAIREGSYPAAIDGPVSVPGVQFVDCAQDRIAEVAISLWQAEAGRAQLISAFKGKLSAGGGTRCLNAICHGARSQSEPLTFVRFMDGEPVIWTQNDYDLGLMNGELGTVQHLSIKSEDDEERLTVNFGDRTIALTREQARNLDLAYAVTVHKAQGSAFDVVVMPIVAHPLLDRTMIYTGLTRARHKAIFVGDRQAFRRAITETPSSGRRRSALAWRLNQEFQTVAAAKPTYMEN